jgi:hypothetical protein
MPAGPEFEAFAGIVMGIIFLIGGYAMWMFMFSSLHEKIGSSDPKDKSSKVATGIILSVIIVAFFSFFFGGNS